MEMAAVAIIMAITYIMVVVQEEGFIQMEVRRVMVLLKELHF